MGASLSGKVVALSVGQVLTTLVSLGLSIVMARLLSQGELATYRQTFLAYQFVLPVLSLGLTNGIYYYLPTEKPGDKSVIVNALFLLAFMGVLYSLFILLGGNNLLAFRFSNPALGETILYLAPLPLLVLPATILPAVLVVKNRVQQLTLFNVLTNLGIATIVISVCFIESDPAVMVIARVMAILVVSVIGIYMIFRAVPFRLGLPSILGIKQLLSYSLPLAAASMIGGITVQLDKMIVSSICSPEEFAVFSTGAVEIPLIGVITGSIATVILPEMRKKAAVNNADEALNLFRLAAGKSALVQLPVMVFLMFCADSFILTLFSEKYQESILPFRLYLLTMPIGIVYGSTYLSAFGKTKAILLRSAFGLAANLVLSIVLVKTIGYIGAIVGSLMSLYFVEGFLNFYHIRNIAQCRWRDLLPLRILAKISGISILAGIPVVLSEYFLTFPPILMIAIDSVLFFSLLLLLIYVFKVDYYISEINRIIGRVKRILHK